MELAIFHQKPQNLDDFERDEVDADFWKAELLNVKEKEMTL